METQLFAKLKDGRFLPVKDFDGQTVSLRIKPGTIITLPATQVAALRCFKGRNMDWGK